MTTLLNKQAISTHLTDIAKSHINDIRIENSVTSTNDILLSEIKNNPRKNTVLLAEEQTAGRGRLGRPWISPAHQNIYLSLSWYVEKPMAELAGLSITVGECLVKALKNFGIAEEITIKWPNDLLHNNQKFCGILIETTAIDKNHTVAVIGIGLNVNYIDEKNNTIDQPWTSLRKITHHTHDRNKLIACILNSLSESLASSLTDQTPLK